MCRNIHDMHNLEPSVTGAEVHDAALQYVRKVSGTTKPAQVNRDAFEQAVAEIAHATEHLLAALVTKAPPKDRAAEADRRRARAAMRFGSVAVPAEHAEVS